MYFGALGINTFVVKVYLDPEDRLISLELCTLQSRIRGVVLHFSSPESKAPKVS